MLYPFKFEPIIKDKIWGGQKLKQILNKPTLSAKSGESWEISDVEEMSLLFLMVLCQECPSRS